MQEYLTEKQKEKFRTNINDIISSKEKIKAIVNIVVTEEGDDSTGHAFAIGGRADSIVEGIKMLIANESSGLGRDIIHMVLEIKAKYDAASISEGVRAIVSAQKQDKETEKALRKLKDGSLNDEINNLMNRLGIGKDDE